jgi:hypothetical protein
MKSVLVTGCILAVFLASLAGGAGVLGQDEQVNRESIEKLVKQLSDDDWHVRERAQKRLAVLGPPVAPYLKKPAESACFEVRFRARAILRGIRFVAPEKAAVIDKCIKEYEPGGDKEKLWKLVVTLRRIKNIRFYLLERMLDAKEKDREKIASLLARVEYRASGWRIDGAISYATDILLSLVRDELVGSELKVRALRGLTRLADKDSIASLMDWLNNEERDLGMETEVITTLESLTGQPEKNPSEDRKVRLANWWSQAAGKPEFATGLKHLEVRKKLEERESQRETPFLGVAKDQEQPDLGGAHVLYPVEGSGAKKADVHSGDVILEFDGRSVDNWDDMVYGLQRSRIGDKVLLKVRRNQKELELQAELTRRIEGQ